MKRFIIYSNILNEVVGKVHADSKDLICNPYSGAGMEALEIPAEIHMEDAAVEITELGKNVIEDQDLKAARTQNERNKKLTQVRAKRDELLKQVDRMVNELVLGVRNDSEEVRGYRAALLSFTDLYKNQAGDATAAIDSLDIDDADSWPTAP